VNHGILMTVKGGGHSLSGESRMKGRAQIAFNLMRGIYVDPEAKTVRVEPGCRIEEMEAATGPFGLAVPTGTVGDTGLYGLMLHGGQGRLSAQFGFGVDNILSCEIVLADGSIVICDEDRRADLFWAVRGSASNFGIVTSLLFQCHEVPLVYRGILVLPYGPPETKQAYETVIEHFKTSPDNATFFLVGSLTPMGTVLAFEFYFYGSVEDGEKFYETIRAIESPIARDWHVVPHYIAQKGTAPPGTFGRGLWYIKGGIKKTWTEEDTEKMYNAFGNFSVPGSMALVLRLGGAIERRDTTKTSYPGCGVYTVEFGGAGDVTSLRQWAREALDILTFDVAYYNFTELDLEDHDYDRELRRLYGQNLEKLREVKAKYDPNDVFFRRLRMNQ